MATGAAVAVLVLLHGHFGAAEISAAGERHGLSLDSLAAWARVDAPLAGEQLEVFIVPHTHDDTGWLETVDGYYEDSVKWILDTATAAVERDQRHRPHCAEPLDPACQKRVFSYVEIDFFEKWWAEQGAGTRNITRKLVAEGRLEFNVAGWCMNDEASPTYSAAINQMTEGHQFVLREFGPLGRAHVGWHVDPFGHSASIASLWSGMGFDAFGLERIDWREKNRRKDSQELEFVWRGSDSLGAETQIFAHILDSHYNTPPEMAYDGDHGSTMRFSKQSGPEQADAFVKMARTRSSYYKHNLLMIPYGDDFMHTHAFRSFDDMDDLMDLINSNPQRYNMTVRYGGLNDYVRAVHALDLEWPVLDGAHPLANGNRDFHPYTTNTHNGKADVWSGYYTSRPKLKGYIRSRENFLRHSELLMTAASLGGTPHGRGTALSSVTALRRAVGVGQHHDAITGTEKDAVTADYMTGLSDATAAVNNATSAIAGRLLQKAGTAAPATAMTADEGVLSLLGEPLPCGGGGGGKPVSLQCVSWRQTADCDATGHNLEPRNDKPCSMAIPSGESGFCECSGGVKRNMVGCTGHPTSFTCEDVCHKPGVNSDKCFGIPPPISFNTTAVILHNTLGWDVTRTIRLPANRSDLIVLDENGTLIPSQINPLPSYDPRASSTRPSSGMKFFPEMSNALDFSSPTFENGFALFFAAELPAASLSTFFIAIDPARAVQGKKQELSQVGGVMESSDLRLQFDVQSGLLASVMNKRNSVNASVKQEMWQYRSGAGDGAYIFRPAERNQEQSNVADALPQRRVLQLKQCTLTDTWHYHFKGAPPSDPGDAYKIVETQNGSFSVTVVESGKAKPGWTTASGTDIDSRISIHFDSGITDSGTVDELCEHILWKDGTQWDRQGAKPVGPTPTPPPSPPPEPPAPTVKSLTGDWDYTNGNGDKDVYRITEDEGAGTFTVGIVMGHEQWHSATGSITGVLKHSVSIKFDSGVTDTGTIGAEYNTIRWKDNSVWTRSGTPPSPPGPGPPPPTPAPGPGPGGVDQAPVSTQPPVSVLYTGPVVDELQQAVTTDGKYSQTYRLYHSRGSFESQAVEITMDIGPLDPGKELVARFTSDIANTAAGDVTQPAAAAAAAAAVTPVVGVASTDGAAGQPVMWTDDNGLEFVRRTTNLAQPEAIPSNFYPISAAAFIRDESTSSSTSSASLGGATKRQLSVLTERAHGAASLATGELEVMLHRRCDSNDNKGNGENLDETDHITTSMMLLIGDVAETAPALRRLSIEQNFAPTALFAPTRSVSAYKATSTTQFGKLLAAPLPPNVHLLSLDQRYGKANATVLRLQHIFEASDQTNLRCGENCTCSAAVIHTK
jgi:hypothetical protein